MYYTHKYSAAPAHMTRAYNTHTLTHAYRPAAPRQPELRRAVADTTSHGVFVRSGRISTATRQTPDARQPTTAI